MSSLPFKLRTAVECSKSDVRSVTRYSDDGFVTGSRDKLGKVFFSRRTDNGFRQVVVLEAATNYVSSTACLPVGDNTYIYLGSNDGNIYKFDIIDVKPTTMMGHSGTVCSLHGDHKSGRLMSGSWDCTAIVWLNDKATHTLKGHSGAVWAVVSLFDTILTGSADKTIKRWNPSGNCVQTYYGHKDCVRDLAFITKDKFLSASNDATIRQWSLKGDLLYVYEGHENYVYSLAVFRRKPDDGYLFASCSEDRTVRIWKNSNETAQVITCPASTLWSIAALNAYEFVVSGSDGRVFVFTQDEVRQASSEEMSLFNEEVSKSIIPLQQLGGVKVSDLPGVERLSIPGKKDGQTMMIREGDKVCLYQWQSIAEQWAKIGDVLGEAPSKSNPNSVTYEGQEYDFVFDIDVQEGSPSLKLPYRNDQDPWAVAQQFIYKHDLSQAFLDQIANFIIKHAGPYQASTAAQTQQTQDTDYCDPFTGGSRYIPK